MKATRLLVNILFTLFLLICIGVHVVGLTTHFSDEPVYSHIIHLISYCLCLYALLRQVPYRHFIYLFAAVYPFLYHGRCAWNSYSLHGKLNAVCILVVVLMPLIGAWIWGQSNIRQSD
jgi:cytochrome bd-type quinol oxidase subunit 2